VGAIWLLCGLVISAPVLAQKKSSPAVGPLLTRTITRHETQRLLYGGTVTLVGAPAGSVTIEGWQRNEVDITAEIELHAATEEDLDRLATINNFIIDADTNHLRILSTGTHDRVLMKRVGRNFPKSLIGLPWKIDYHIRVPYLTDLEVSAGKGSLKLSGVEGTIHLNAVESDVNLTLTGGLVFVIVQSGAVSVSIPALGWHGLGADVKLAGGNLIVELLSGLNADINAEVLRMGEIRTNYPGLQAREPNSLTPRSIRARAGSGGATLAFTVGDGTIEIRQKTEDRKQ
jgi:hypothetical protein